MTRAFFNTLVSIIILFTLGFIINDRALAVVTFSNSNSFEQPSIVRSQTRFWNKIFQTYDSSSALIHDAHHPDHVIDVVNFNRLLGKSVSGISYSQKNSITEKYLNRYREAIKRFSKLGKNATKYGAIEKRLYSVYFRQPYILKKLYKGKITLRSQMGLKDSMIIAGSKAQDYLPHMEQIFIEENVPPILTRIAFVESMFNLKAKSKVGASGIWQFMPATAKNYLQVTPLIDERNSPLKATRAAARLLRDNYSILKSWPLAITAYNHGVNGMRNAAKTLGTNDIGQIIKYYKSNSFGFASRNFYSEFLAAKISYDRLLSLGSINKRPTNFKVASIRLNKRMSTHELLNNTPLTKYVLEKFNGCLKSNAFTSHKHSILPVNYELFVPAFMAKDLKISLGDSKGKRYAYK